MINFFWLAVVIAVVSILMLWLGPEQTRPLFAIALLIDAFGVVVAVVRSQT